MDEAQRILALFWKQRPKQMLSVLESFMCVRMLAEEGSVTGEWGAGPCLLCLFLTGDGRWSTYNVSVPKKMGGKMRIDRTPSKATITNKTRPDGSFSSS